MINSVLMDILSGVGAPVFADCYSGKEPVYITFNSDLVPIGFGDNLPQAYRALIQVHVYAPTGKNIVALRKEVMGRIANAGMIAPSESNETTPDYQHYVIETEALEDIPWQN